MLLQGEISRSSAVESPDGQVKPARSRCQPMLKLNCHAQWNSFWECGQVT